MQKKSLETFFYSVGGVIAMLIIIVALNLIIGVARKRVDLTSESAYTLSAGTRAILAKLEAPVKIRFYSSQSVSVTPETVFLKGYARKVEDLLAEYKQAAKGKIVIEKFDPQPDSDAEDAARLNGVEGVPLQSGERFYMGLSVSILGAEQAISFLQPNRERELEYDISRAITRVVTPEKPVVGVMSSLPLFGMQSNPMMQQMGQRGQPAWLFLQELQSDFTVQRVEMNAEKIADEVRVLVVVHPKEISDAAQFAIDQFILRGGKLIAFLDASSLVDSRNQQNPMMPTSGGGSSLDKLLKAWGITFENTKVVADVNFQLEVGGGDGASSQRPTWLSITPEGINTNDLVTSQIDNIWYFSGGSFAGTPVAGLTQTILLKSTTASALVDGFLANMSPEAAMKEFKPSGKEQTLALRLAGKFKTAFPDGKPAAKTPDEAPEGEKKAEDKKTGAALKESQVESSVILVGDSDLINDNFAVQETQTPFGAMRRMLNANLTFAQNAIEQMSGDNNLITVRSRAVLNRPFTLVKKMEAEANERSRSKINELQASLEQAQQRLSELQQNKDKDQRYIISPEQQKEVEGFRKKEAEVSAALKKEKKNLRVEVDGLQTRLTWWTILTMPVLVCLTGIILAGYKRKLTAAR